MSSKTDRINLDRTFSLPYGDDEGLEHIELFAPRERKSGFTWKDLHEKPVTVVVGEAGIGKTIEFENEVQRLQEAGKKAFFVALNELIDRNGWELALELSRHDYDQWKLSSEKGYFFLDAIDEARLSSHASFKKAIKIVLANLRPFLGRVHIVISSRWSDWTIDDVSKTVGEFLVIPIQDSYRKITLPTENKLDSNETNISIVPAESKEQLEAFVVKLDPLSRPEAQKFATAKNVVNPSAFWAAIDDGGYDFMASRPLDLEWLVSLWNQKRSLGRYLELIEGYVSNQLTETNPSYVAAGKVLSVDQLHEGAEILAAATVFTEHYFIATNELSSSRPDEIFPKKVLPGWAPLEIARLLASAVFDEATYGRVKFHQRSVREYLAAQWVHRQLEKGVPVSYFLSLFYEYPYDEPVLIPSRRWTLSWLASINVKVREWVISHFPEMFFFDGDQEAWGVLSAEKALQGFVRRLADGYRTDWFNDLSEFRRIGRCLDAKQLSAFMTDPQMPMYVKSRILPIIKHAHMKGCADAIFSSYQHKDSTPRERRYALEVLSTIATPEQQALIKSDLLSGVLTTNELIGEALSAAGWQSFTVEELVQLFSCTGSEDGYGSGSMTYTIKYDLLPSATVESATSLLEAVINTMPQQEKGERFVRYPESDQPLRAWLLDVLPHCLERLLTILPPSMTEYPAVCQIAAEHLEALRDSGYLDRGELDRIHDLVKIHPKLRWQLGLIIAKSKGLIHATSRVAWDKAWCIISFDASDMPELIKQANDGDISPEDRAIWFEIAKEVAFRHLRGLARKAVFIELENGPEKGDRSDAISKERAQWVSGAKQRRLWNKDERQRKREKAAQFEKNKDILRSGIKQIEDRTAIGYLNWLFKYSYENSGRHDFSRVDFDLISKEIGKDIADALKAGLKSAWKNIEVPNPAESGNTVPWDVIHALAGLKELFSQGLAISTLKPDEIKKAARLATWETNGPPPWFETIASQHRNAVCEALSSWICSDTLVEEDGYSHRGALSMVLRCPEPIRRELLSPSANLINSGKIAFTDRKRKLFEVLCQDGLLDRMKLATLYRDKLLQSMEPDGLIGEIKWLGAWLGIDSPNAWSWFEDHISGLDEKTAEQVNAFAKAMEDTSWIETSAANDETIEVLLKIHSLLTNHIPRPNPSGENDQPAMGNPVINFRGAIPNVLVQIPGSRAHSAMCKLAKEENNPDRKEWLNSRLYDHSSIAVSMLEPIKQTDLIAIGSPFLTVPQNESQLFKQVMARLEEIRKGIEEGPFSDRDLFSLGMPEQNIPEKMLQLWLAARFLDTQNRKFGVHREEEVDANNRTDIQLSSHQWNVCVEIKPLDSSRSYSAKSLVDTLRTQIVGQYLKGYNSKRGILVLFRLDDKTWEIPGIGRNQPFSALVSHLKEQARQIKLESPSVEELVVFAIDCAKPE